MHLRDLLQKAALREHLTRDEAAYAIGEIMEGRATAAWIGAFLVAMRMKGETVEELTGAAMALRARATRVRGPESRPLVDTCGTGGDAQGTFNISTGAALLVAAAGGAVAKHGNRAVSSRAGSADVLEALGIAIDVDVPRLEACLDAHGFAFLFAQRLHPAMRNAAGPRRELGLRTLFNLVGPLANPAQAPHQLLGVYDRALLFPMAEVLGHLGVQRALVVHARDGLDEISPCAPTDAAHLDGGEIRTLTLSPESLGVNPAPGGALRGGDATENAAILSSIFHGENGPRRDAITVNAGAALWLCGLAEDPRAGVRLASEALDRGAALATLNALRAALPHADSKPHADSNPAPAAETPRTP